MASYSNVSIKLTADDKSFLKSLSNINSQIDKISKSAIKLNLDTRGVSGISNIKKQLESISNKKVNVDIQASTGAVSRIQNQLSSIKPPKLELGNIKPLAGIDKLNAQLEATKIRYDNLFTKKEVNLSSVKTAEIQLGSLKQRIADIGKGMSGIGNSASSSAAGVNSLSGAVKGLVLAAGKILVILEAFNQLKSAVTGSIDLEDQLVGVQRTTNASNEELDKLKKGLQSYSEQTRTSLKDLVTIAQIGGQLGIPTDQLEKSVKAINQVNVALGTDYKGNVEQVTNDLATLRNGFASFRTQDTAGDFGKIANALVELGNAGTATGPEMSELGRRISGLAPNAKLDEVLGLSAAVQEFGITAEKGGTAVGQLLSEMSKPTKFDKDGNITGGLGLMAQAAGKTEEEFRKLVDISQTDALLALAANMDVAGSSTTELSEKFAAIGIDGSGATIVLNKFAGNIQTVKDRLNTAKEAIKDVTTIQQSYDKANNTTAANLEKLGNKFNNLKTVVGDSVQGAFDQVLSFDFGGLLQSIIDNPIVQSFINMWKSLGGSISGALASPQVQDAFSKLKEALAKLGTALQPVITFVGFLIQKFYGLLAAVLGSQQMKDIIGAVVTFILDNLTLWLNSLTDLTNWIVNVAVPWIVGAFNNLSSFVSQAITTIVDIWGWMKNTWNTIVGNVINFIFTLIENFAKFVTDVTNSIRTFVEDVKTNFTNMRDNMVETVGNAISTVLEFFGNLPNQLGEFFGNIISKAGDLGNSIKDAILNALSNLAKTIKNIVSSAVGGAMNAVGGAVSAAGDAVGLHGGGIVPQYRAQGGTIYANKGMFIPRGTDTVPAMLTPGEFVINKQASKKIGSNLLNMMNQEPDKFLSKLNGLLSATHSVVGSSNNSVNNNDNKQVNISVNYNNANPNPATLLYNLNSLISTI